MARYESNWRSASVEVVANCPPAKAIGDEGTPRPDTRTGAYSMDVVIADTPAPPHVKVFNHLLGESDTAFFAPPQLATRLRRRFPRSLRRRRRSHRR